MQAARKARGRKAGSEAATVAEIAALQAEIEALGGELATIKAARDKAEAVRGATVICMP